MAYIGRDISNLSDRVVLDSITTSATATYNLLLNSVAFVPSSAESLTVSLNGVIQKPQGSYTVSGSTIVFDSALTSSDVIDFILAERAITLTTIGSGTVDTSNLVDDAVTTAKINDGAITSAKLDSGLGLGKILQYKTAKNNTQFDTNSYTFAEMDTNLRLTITPTSASNKLIITLNLMWLDINSGGRGTIVRFMRSINGGGDVNLGSDDGGTVDMFYNWDEGRYQRPVKYTYIDTTHNTTSSIVYKFFAGTDAGNTVRFGANTRYSTTEVVEIA